MRLWIRRLYDYYVQVYKFHVIESDLRNGGASARYEWIHANSQKYEGSAQSSKY